MNRLRIIAQILSNDKLFRAVLRTENEINRIEFLGLFLLRYSLLFSIAQIVTQPFVLIILSFYLIHDLTRARCKHIGAGRFWIISISILLTIYLYYSLVALNYFLSRYGQFLFQSSPRALEIANIRNASVWIRVSNFALSIIGILNIISILFLLLKKGRSTNQNIIKPGEIFSERSFAWHLFSFGGSTTRINYLFAHFFVQLIFIVLYALIIILLLLKNGSIRNLNHDASEILYSNRSLTLVFFGIQIIFALWTYFAITVKRLHHLGNNGNWVWLIFLLGLLYVISNPILMHFWIAAFLQHKSVLYYEAFSYDIGFVMRLLTSVLRFFYTFVMIYLLIYPGIAERAEAGRTSG